MRSTQTLTTHSSYKKVTVLFNSQLKKSFDAVFSDKSAMLFVFVSLDSAEKCMHLFQAIVDAKRAGETVFYLSDYLKKQMPCPRRFEIR